MGVRRRRCWRATASCWRGSGSPIPTRVAEESLFSAQLVQAVLQAEHRQDRVRHGQADTGEVDVTYEFIRAAVDRVAA